MIFSGSSEAQIRRDNSNISKNRSRNDAQRSAQGLKTKLSGFLRSLDQAPRAVPRAADRAQDQRVSGSDPGEGWGEFANWDEFAYVYSSEQDVYTQTAGSILKAGPNGKVFDLIAVSGRRHRGPVVGEAGATAKSFPLPVATPVPGKEGFVFLGFDPRGLPAIDVRGIPSGTVIQVEDPLRPMEMIRFRVP